MTDLDFVCLYENYWNCSLPVKGSDDPSFITMGIEFGSFADGDQFRDAKLPDGWKIEESNKKYWHNIIDDKNRSRAEFFISKPSSLSPRNRFSLLVSEEDIRIIFRVIDNNHGIGEKNIVLFEIVYPMPNRNSYRQIYKQKMAEYLDHNICEKWINEHYPKWRDGGAYWDDEEQKELL